MKTDKKKGKKKRKYHLASQFASFRKYNRYLETFIG